MGDAAERDRRHFEGGAPPGARELVVTIDALTPKLSWRWDGKPAVIQSRATDETGYVQPTSSFWRCVATIPFTTTTPFGPGASQRMANCPMPTRELWRSEDKGVRGPHAIPEGRHHGRITGATDVVVVRWDRGQIC